MLDISVITRDLEAQTPPSHACAATLEDETGVSVPAVAAQ